jgi:hypothetical protein
MEERGINNYLHYLALQAEDPAAIVSAWRGLYTQIYICHVLHIKDKVVAVLYKTPCY